MPRIVLTRELSQYARAPSACVEGCTVREALEALFATDRELRTHILDERGRLRHHVAVFVDGAPLEDRASLADPLREDSELQVLQALAGG